MSESKVDIPDDPLKTNDPVCQKYVQPTLELFPDFPKDKIKYLKLPPFKELTDEDKKSFISRVSIAFVIQTMLTYFLKYLQTTQCQSTIRPVSSLELGSFKLHHMHKLEYQQNYSPYENYLPDGKKCGNLDILLIVAFLFSYIASYIEQNYPDEYEQYIQQKPLNATWSNLVSLSQSTMIAWAECFTGGGDVVLYTFGIILIYFFMHAIYSGFLPTTYTKYRAIGLCIFVSLACGTTLYFTQHSHKSVYYSTSIAFCVCTLIIILMNMMVNGIEFPNSVIASCGKLNIGIMKIIFSPMLCVSKCGLDFITCKVFKKDYQLPRIFDICKGPNGFCKGPSGSNCMSGIKGGEGCNCVVSCQCPGSCKKCCDNEGVCECCYQNPDSKFQILAEEGEIELQNIQKEDQIQDKKELEKK